MLVKYDMISCTRNLMPFLKDILQNCLKCLLRYIVVHDIWLPAAKVQSHSLDLSPLFRVHLEPWSQTEEVQRKFLCEENCWQFRRGRDLHHHHSIKCTWSCKNGYLCSEAHNLSGWAELDLRRKRWRIKSQQSICSHLQEWAIEVILI